ncbi:LLM class flavin-dependent oxidoreductase [uncultured Jatrophihabitans sp.]|uniref:LLM class flavin-dependent oxidoreductase n=1 Tax=uncultured Jatrophihabitans sp. TaxID=1610747 RepID=UPI0035CB32E6
MSDAKIVDTAAIPETAADQVEFVSITGYNRASELNGAAGKAFDFAFYREYVAALEEAGFDYTLNGYSSASADSFVIASATGQLTERLKPIVALRPNHTFPLVAAQKLATLDQLTRGRAVVHLISGGFDAEQRKQGDYEPKARRYARTSEFIDLLRRAWTEQEPFSFDSEFYTFDDFGPGFRTYSGDPVPISIGGQSDEAFEVGAAKADWFTFNAGESITQVRTDIERVHRIAGRAGRPNPRIWVTFRPIVAPTDEQAWEKAFDYAAKAGASAEGMRARFLGKTKINPAESEGGKRQQSYAAADEGYDRASWSGIVRATGGAGGASTALVGSYETVAAAIVDQVDAGASIVSIRGFDILNDVVDYGKNLLPLVRQEIAHRKATSRRGDLQRDAAGFDSAEYVAAHQRAAERALASQPIGASA